MTVVCSYCGKPASLVDGAKIYPHRPDLKAKRFWECEPCRAYVGCRGGAETPLGRLANAELRDAKMRARAAFEPIWRTAAPRDRARLRREAYEWLGRAMKLPPDQTHIGMMDVEQCKLVVALCAQLDHASTAARAEERTAGREWV